MSDMERDCRAYELEDQQPSLFVAETTWEEHWQGMPEFVQEDLTSFRSIIIHFRNQQDIDAFSEIIGQRIYPKQKSYWHPQLEIRRGSDKRYVDDES